MKLIGKVMKNNSFTATTKYVIEKEQATIIGGNMVGENPKELVTEFMISHDLNPGIRRPVYHFTLSLPKHEDLNNKQFAALAETYLGGMFVLDKGQDIDKCFSFLKDLDLNTHQFFVARHTDREHQHIHIVASRINLIDGKTIQTWHDCYRSEKLIRRLEETYNLQPGICSWEVGKKAQTKSQLELLGSTGVGSVKSEMQSAIEHLATNRPTLPSFLKQLHKVGIETNITYNPNKEIRGISYCLDDVAISGSKLGKRYSFPGLQKYLGISYEPERDEIAITEIVGQKTEHQHERQWATEHAESRPTISNITTGIEPEHNRAERHTRSAMAGSNKSNKSSQRVRAKHPERAKHMDRDKSKSDAASITSSGDNRQTDNRVDEIQAAQEQFRRIIEKFEQSVTEFEREVTRGEHIWQEHQSDSREVTEASTQDITNETDALRRDSDLSRNFDHVGDVSSDGSIGSLAADSGITAGNTKSDQQQNEQFRDSVAEVGKTDQTLKRTVNSATDPVDDTDPLDTNSQQKGDRQQSHLRLLSNEVTHDESLNQSRATNKSSGRSNKPKQSTSQTQLDKLQQEWARAIYPIAQRIYDTHPDQRSTTITTSGMVVVAGNYQISHDTGNNNFSIAANDDRGEVIRYKANKLEYAANLEDQDLDNWKVIEQQLNQINFVQVQNTGKPSADIDLDL